MNKNELLKKISADSDTELKLSLLLNSKLENELKKPLKKQNFIEIEKITCSIRALGESDEAIMLRDECGKKAILEKANQYKTPFRKYMLGGAITVLCCITLIFALNAYSFSTWGMSIFSAVVKYTGNGVTLDFSLPDNYHENKNTDFKDNYGIKEKYAEYGIEAQAPEFIPEGFKLSDFQCEKLSYSTNCCFYFTHDNIIFNLTIEKYDDSEMIPPVLIPNDQKNVSEEFHNGNLVYIMNNDNSYTAVYSSGNIVYFIYTDNLDYDTLIKILNSMK